MKVSQSVEDEGGPEYSDTAMLDTLTRRVLLRRATVGAAALTVGPGLLAACGSSSGSSTGNSAASPVRGKTIRMINYASWIGPNEAPDFKKQTGTTIQQIVVDADQTRISKIDADPTSADMTLGDLSDAGRLAGLGLLAKLDLTKIPNYGNLQAFAKTGDFSPSLALGVPVDFGRDGFVYRTDLVKDNIASWADLFRLAPKYSGKIVLMDFEEDTLASALLALGYGVNTTNPAEIEKAGKLLISIKPHLLALETTNFMQMLMSGQTWITMDWDYDAGAAIQAHPQAHMKWVDPADGMRAYLDGWEAIKTTTVLPEIEEWMNFHLEPQNYGNFVNATATSPAMLPASLPYVSAAIRNDPVLNPPKSVTDRITFDRGHGESQMYRDQAWANFKSA